MASTNEKKINSILKCYKILYEIEQGADKKEKFKKAFSSVTLGDSYLFKDKDVLNGSFEIQMDKSKEPKSIKINGETLLFRAITKYGSDSFIDEMGSRINSCKGDDTRNNDLRECIEYMIETRQDLITAPREKDGYSPLYLVIVKGHTDLIRKMISLLNWIDIPQVKRSSFGSTVMLAGFPLGVAALTLNKKVFRRVLDGLNKDHWKEAIKNEINDTIVHCLIKYAHYHSDKLTGAMKMLRYILDETTWTSVGIKSKCIVEELIIPKNKEQLTPLQLAAKRQQFELFDIIIHSKKYYNPSMEDGLSIVKEYDITELDTMPVCDDNKGTEDEYVVKENHFSVLEFVYQQNMPTAFSFADCKPVSEVIKAKWLEYRRPFYLWSLLHLLVMGLLTWSGIRRSSLMFKYDNSSSRYVRNSSPVCGDGKSRGLTIVGFLYAFLFTVIPFFYHVFYECYRRRIGARMKANFCRNLWRSISHLPYTNKVLKISFVIFGILLILDLPLSLSVHGYENWCLMFALIIGWYLVLFFLQVFESFSFFTVLIQRVMKDMVNFAIVMGILLLGFTAAMSMLMEGVNNPEDDFSGFDKSLLTMFTVMLGIGEINDIFKVRQPFAAVIVFVLFVLLTTILLLNALIAMMSNSCTELTIKHGTKKCTELHATMQRLSVIIFLESKIPMRLWRQVGEIKSGRRSIRITMELDDKYEDDNDDDAIGNKMMNYLKSLFDRSKKRSNARQKNRKDTSKVAATTFRGNVELGPWEKQKYESQPSRLQ